MALLLLLVFKITPLQAQWVGTRVVLTGSYIEAVFNLSGSIGHNTSVLGLHHASVPGYFGIVGDTQKDGWAVSSGGTPPFCGDYIANGSLEERFSLTLSGNHVISANLMAPTVDTFRGKFVHQVMTAGDDTLIWAGKMHGMRISHTYIVPQNDLFVLCEVALRNDTSYTHTGVYYGRNMDPNGEVYYGGSPNTYNTVTHQPVLGLSDTAIVQAAGIYNCDIFLASRHADAVANYGSIPSPTALDLWLGTGRTTTVGVTGYANEAIGMGWSLGDILPGDSVSFRFAYVLDTNDLDIALLRLGPPCPFIEDTVALTSCGSYLFGTNVLTASGSYLDTLRAITGCDSIVHLNLTVLPLPAATYLAAASCDSYTFHGSVLTASGSYVDTLISAVNGCDSLVHLGLTVNHSATTTLTVDACDSYLFEGSLLTSSGAYTSTHATAAGCDSTVTLNLSISTSPDTSVIASGATLTAAAGYTYQWLDCDASFAPIPGATSQSFTAPADGHYAVALVNGTCVDTSACNEVLVTAADPGMDQLFSLSPNPVTNELNILYAGPKADIQISTLMGQVMWERKDVLGGKVKADLSGLASGVYIVRVRTDLGTEMQKVVVQ